ncbi:hypothetical protein ACGFS9_22885 [Streptomyces sp. NPDC048566]|uniref:hypothetical protein n=1 Tax=unclassified Streptomyces TaxID=2593676 RepID=UPI0033C3083F
MNLFTKTAVVAATGGALVFGGASIAGAQDNGDTRIRTAVAKSNGTDSGVRVASADEAKPWIALAQEPGSEVVTVAAGDDKPIAPSLTLKA